MEARSAETVFGAGVADPQVLAPAVATGRLTNLR